MMTRRDAGIGGKAITAIMAVVGVSLWGVVGCGAVEKIAGSMAGARHLLLDSRIEGKERHEAA